MNLTGVHGVFLPSFKIDSRSPMSRMKHLLKINKLIFPIFELMYNRSRNTSAVKSNILQSCNFWNTSDKAVLYFVKPQAAFKLPIFCNVLFILNLCLKSLLLVFR